MNCPVIGITGGVGAGKSVAIDYLKSNYDAHVIVADDLANELKLKGNACYQPIVDLLGEGILNESGEIDKPAMAAAIYRDPALLDKINNIIHPAVRQHIEAAIKTCKSNPDCPCLIIEAALLIECGYKPLLDELWYIYAPVDLRSQRLHDSRGYSPAKSESIMSAQLKDEDFRAYSDRIIVNNGVLEDYYRALDEAMKEVLSFLQK